MKHLELDAPKNPEELVGNFIFQEYDLDEIGFPSHGELLGKVQRLEKEIEVEGWKTKGFNSDQYKGFSLTYNKDFDNKETSVYHQTIGDYQVQNMYSKDSNTNQVISDTNSYYDTYGFRHVHDNINREFKEIFDKIEGAILRSRVSHLYSHKFPYDQPKTNWHIDEVPYGLMRLIIPVQTNEDYVIRMNGSDEFGNSIKDYEVSLELGKAYMWNNRIPHQMAPLRPSVVEPRINIIIGFSPWFNYNEEKDTFEKSATWGLPISYIVDNMLWLNE